MVKNNLKSGNLHFQTKSINSFPLAKLIDICFEKIVIFNYNLVGSTPNRRVKQRFCGTGYNWNREIPGMNRPCVSTGLRGPVPSATANRFQLGLLSI